MSADHDIHMLITSTIQDADGDPKSLAEARSRPNWPLWILWKVAMDKETSRSCLTLLFAARQSPCWLSLHTYYLIQLIFSSLGAWDRNRE